MSPFIDRRLQILKGYPRARDKLNIPEVLFRERKKACNFQVQHFREKIIDNSSSNIIGVSTDANHPEVLPSACKKFAEFVTLFVFVQLIT